MISPRSQQSGILHMASTRSANSYVAIQLRYKGHTKASSNLGVVGRSLGSIGEYVFCSVSRKIDSSTDAIVNPQEGKHDSLGLFQQDERNRRQARRHWEES